MRARRRLAVAVVLVALLGAPAPRARAAAGSLPGQLTGRQFWDLITTCSEQNGYFQSDNLVSNEHTLQYVIPALSGAVAPGGVYLGVAPDQNFTYILATRPKMAFIVDIRRGNLQELLMYKALFELSKDRAEFISRLFTKPRPPGLDDHSSVDELFAKFDDVRTDDDKAYQANLAAIENQLTQHDGLPLDQDDRQGIEYVYYQFYWYGPALAYSVAPLRYGANFPDYAYLMEADDGLGTAARQRSYLASEANFQEIKQLEARNLIVPIVGNFAGPKALRAVGQYIREHGAVVSAFYVSNVEQYLFQDASWRGFYDNVATLPVDASSTFIRSVSSRFGYGGAMLGPDGRASALDPIAAFVRDYRAGRIQTYYDVNARSK